MPDNALNVAKIFGEPPGSTIIGAVNNQIIFDDNTRCWPECLYVDIRGGGQYAPGQPGATPQWRLVIPKTWHEPCIGKATYCGTGFSPGQSFIGWVQIGPDINPFGGVGSCGMCGGNYGIMLTFWLDYEDFPGTNYIPGLRGLVTPQPLNGDLPNHYWDDCIYCNETGGLCAPPNLDGLEFDLVTNIGWFGFVMWYFTGTIYSCLPASWSDMNISVDPCTPQAFLFNGVEWVERPATSGPFANF